MKRCQKQAAHQPRKQYDELDDIEITIPTAVRPETPAEVAELQKSEKVGIKYEIRDMPFVSTLRQLPKGYSASQHAKDEAKKYYGITDLPEGWTFVSSGVRPTYVRINPETNEPFVRKIEFRDGSETPQERLLRMIDEIKRGEKPRRR